MPRAANGTLIDSGLVTVTLDGSGNGTGTIAFTETFFGAPTVALQALAADAGSWTVSAIDTNGATVTAATSDYRSRDLVLAWTAMEKR